MHLTDINSINGKDGPYWAAYQEERKRKPTLYNHNFVPFWFLTNIACARVKAARVAVEQSKLVETRLAWARLRDLEVFLDTSIQTGEGHEARRLVVLALLGAEEVHLPGES